jgi:nitroreductase
MSFYGLVKRSRTVRRYHEATPIPKSILIDLVDTARLVASAGNRQPIRYIICNDRELNLKLFEGLGWLGYFGKDTWPIEGERPAAYIILLGDSTIANASFQYDAGIASQTIILGANNFGLGCCIIGAVNHQKVKELFDISLHLSIISVISLGYPMEIVRLEEAKDESDIKYWRDENKIHHVPKLLLDQVLVGDYCND